MNVLDEIDKKLEEILRKLNLMDGKVLIDEEYVTPQEAAKLLGISNSKIYYQIRNNQLPHLRRGGLIKIKKTDLL